MPDQPHRVLWERMKQGLAEHGALKAGAATERETAAHAEKVIGEDLGKRLVRRFVDSYYLPKMYAPTSVRLTDVEAEGLVAQLLRELERLPRASDTVPTATSAGEVGRKADGPSVPAKRLAAIEAAAFGTDRVLQALHERLAHETRELESAREEVKRREGDLAAVRQELDRERQKLSAVRLVLQQELAAAEERRTEAEEAVLQAKRLRVEQEELTVRAAEKKAEAEAAALEAARKKANIEQEVVALTQRKIEEEQKILELRTEGGSLRETALLAALDKELQLQQLKLLDQQKDRAQRDLEALYERQREAGERRKQAAAASASADASRLHAGNGQVLPPHDNVGRTPGRPTTSPSRAQTPKRRAPIFPVRLVRLAEKLGPILLLAACVQAVVAWKAFSLWHDNPEPDVLPMAEYLERGSPREWLVLTDIDWRARFIGYKSEGNSRSIFDRNGPVPPGTYPEFYQVFATGPNHDGPIKLFVDASDGQGGYQREISGMVRPASVGFGDMVEVERDAVIMSLGERPPTLAVVCGAVALAGVLVLMGAPLTWRLVSTL